MKGPDNEGVSGRTAAQRQWQTEREARQRETWLSFCTRLRICHACRVKACRRARICRGDPHECFLRFWRKLPEESKVWLRAGISARCSGASVEQARNIADSERARWLALQNWAPGGPLTRA